MELDINECTTQQDNCDATVSTCVNFPGGYNCSCDAGYQVWKILVFFLFKKILN